MLIKDLYRNSNVWLNAKRLTLQGGTMCEERCCTPSGRVSAYGSYYVRANPSCRFHSCQENGWFSVWGKFKHLVIQRGTSDAEKHTKQEKNDVWQQIPGNASYPWPCLVRQSSRSKTGSSLLLQQLLVAHICEQHDGLKKKKNMPLHKHKCLVKDLIIQLILRLYPQMFGIKTHHSHICSW